jgi:mycoredoxin
MKVTVYSAFWCPDCREAKRFLQGHSISFQEIDIENTPGAADEVVKRTGKRAVPQFVIDGEWVQPYRPGLPVRRNGPAPGRQRALAIAAVRRKISYFGFGNFSTFWPLGRCAARSTIVCTDAPRDDSTRIAGRRQRSTSQAALFLQRSGANHLSPLRVAA